MAAPNREKLLLHNRFIQVQQELSDIRSAGRNINDGSFQFTPLSSMQDYHNFVHKISDQNDIVYRKNMVSERIIKLQNVDHYHYSLLWKCSTFSRLEQTDGRTEM